jgi:hypothetical protein
MRRRRSFLMTVRVTRIWLRQTKHACMRGVDRIERDGPGMTELHAVPPAVDCYMRFAVSPSIPGGSWRPCYALQVLRSTNFDFKVCLRCIPPGPAVVGLRLATATLHGAALSHKWIKAFSRFSGTTHSTACDTNDACLRNVAGGGPHTAGVRAHARERPVAGADLDAHRGETV